MSQYKIYCDLDGVLIDFIKGYKDLTGIDITDLFIPDSEFWGPIDKAGSTFWENLEWRSDGKKLWDYIKKYDPIILSAPSKHETSRVGKKLWVDRELPNVRLVLRSAKHKSDFSEPLSILIDDRPDTIERWNEKGGIGIHHVNTEDTIKQLQLLDL